MKTCLFGGTFDPPHFGHLIVAQTIFEAEHFDRIVFVPAYIPPHKKERKISSVEIRLEMLKIATKDNPNFEISDIELKRGGISYSLETIKTYKKETGLGRKDLYYLIGSDSLKQFQDWQDPKAILDECQLIVAIRPGFRPSDIPNWILAKVQFANIPRIEISSTQIRERWVEDKTIRYMVTQPVWTFINKHNLY
ncbi:MAG: nicotinate (nicotinamide) nucleotide adenylyltransferase [Candidatus Marinimicrobia bacterium]|nr:nicotinate (nicotinamide) nucleotide adenylyltransferase [Candidatus Neomarinimicrobiota bacterium]MBT7921181.1 nicotinate (nicotinamide) nucleotide adenylyltransferase [Candidatus Neomarinimicrobiota bacterium]